VQLSLQPALQHDLTSTSWTNKVLEWPDPIFADARQGRCLGLSDGKRKMKVCDRHHAASVSKNAPDSMNIRPPHVEHSFGNAKTLEGDDALLTKGINNSQPR